MKSIIQEYKYCGCFWEVVPHRMCLDSVRRQSGEKEIDLWFRGFCKNFSQGNLISDHKLKIKTIKNYLFGKSYEYIPKSEETSERRLHQPSVKAEEMIYHIQFFFRVTYGNQ